MQKDMQELRKFADKHGIETVNGYWWCGGFTWNERDYRVVLCAVAPVGHSARVRAVAAELRAETPKGLAAAMREYDWRAPSVKRIAEMCESAECSPKPPRRRGGRARRAHA